MATITVTSPTTTGTTGNDKFIAGHAILDLASGITINGDGGSDGLYENNGGDVDLANDTLIGVQSIFLTGAGATFLTLGGSAETVHMGSNASTIAIGGTANDTFIFGAGGQEADGGTANNVYTFTELTAAGSTVDGNGVTNKVNLTGGGVFIIGSGPCDLNLSDVQTITIGGASTALLLDCGGTNSGYVIHAGGGADLFDMFYGACHQTLVAGNGSDIVVMGSTGQHVSLGNGGGANGTNSVFVYDAEVGGNPYFVSFVNDLNNVVYTNQHDLAWNSVINGGSGPDNWLVVTPGSCDPVCDIDGNIVNVTNGSPDCGTVIMGARVVGFSVVDFNQYCDDANFVANTTSGLTILGSQFGGDCITLNATNQSYFAGLCDDCSNTVTLSTGLTSGATLAGAGCDTLVIAFCDSGDTYNFNATGVNVSGFSTVDVYGDNTTLTLNAPDGYGYCVNIETGCASAFAGVFTGGAGDDNFNIYASGSCDPVLTGSINGGGGFNTLTVECGVYADVTQLATLSHIAEIDIDKNATLVLTSDQLLAGPNALESQLGGVAIDGGSCATLVIDVSNDNPDFNLASLNIESSFCGQVVIVSESVAGGGDTIEGGPQNNQIIVVGEGNDWVNAGSGSTTVEAGYLSGTSVLISGNGCDTFEFGTYGQLMTTDDTIVGPNPNGSGGVGGQLTIEVVCGATVDFTGATFIENFVAPGASGPIQPSVVIESGATAIFNLSFLATDPFASITDPGGTLQINTDKFTTASSATDTITLADLAGDEGPVVINVTNGGGNSPTSTETWTTVDITQLVTGGSGPSSVEVIGNGGAELINADAGATTLNATLVVGNGVEAIGGGSGGQTIVFGVTSGPTEVGGFFVTSDIIDGYGGASYTIDVNANTDFQGATFGLDGIGNLSAAFDNIANPFAEGSGFDVSLTVNIGAGVTAKVAAQDVSPPHTGMTVYGGYNNDDLGQSDLDIVLGASGKVVNTFTQSSINVVTDSDILETIDATNGNDTVFLNEQYLLTSVLLAQGDTVTVETPISGSLADSFSGTGASFLVIGATSAPAEPGSADVDANFTGSTVNGYVGGSTTQLPDTSRTLQEFTIHGNSTAEFYSHQVDGDTAYVGTVLDTDPGNLIIDVNESIFSLELTQLGQETINTNLLLQTNYGTITINTGGTGETISAGIGVEIVNDGYGGNTIYAGDNLPEGTPGDTPLANDTVNQTGGGALDFDTIIGTGVDNTTLTINLNVAYDATNYTPTETPVQEQIAEGGTTYFAALPDTITGNDNNDEAPATVNVNVEQDTDLTGATITGVDSITVDGGHDVIFTDTQLSQFNAVLPDEVALTAQDDDSVLIIDDKAATFAPVVNGVGGYDLNVWNGFLQIDGTTGTQVINTSNLVTTSFDGGPPANLTDQATLGDVTGLPDHGDAIYLYGGAGNDTFQFGATTPTVSTSVVDDTTEYNYTAPVTNQAYDDTIVGMSGFTNTIEALGTGTNPIVNFTDPNSDTGSAYGTIQNINIIQVDNAAAGTTTKAIFSSAEIRGDMASLGSHDLTFMSGHGAGEVANYTNHAYNYTIEIDANSEDGNDGNLNLSSVVTVGTYNVGLGSDTALVYIHDTNDTSVTVYGTENGFLNTSATDIIEVGGYGDTVVPGTGQNFVIFDNYNAANNAQFTFADLEASTAASPSNGGPLSREADLVRGLGAGAGEGYVDINVTGFGLNGTAVDNTPVNGVANLNLDTLFGADHYGLVQDSADTTTSFIAGTGIGETIFATGVFDGASSLVGAIDVNNEKGFVTVEDTNSDFALFYITGGDSGVVQLDDIKLIGVFDTLTEAAAHTNSGSAGTLSSILFHLHS